VTLVSAFGERERLAEQQFGRTEVAVGVPGAPANG
jgi:hypothetical protein